MEAFLKRTNSNGCSASKRTSSLKEQSTCSVEVHLKKKIKREKTYQSDIESDEYQIDTPPLEPPPDARRDGTPDSLTDDDVEKGSELEDAHTARPTAIETCLPETKSGKQATEEYQDFKASQEDAADSASARLDSRAWVKGKSSIYVDAFNLTLDTVLDEEAHLFNDKETQIFKEWRSLSYEAQFLYAYRRLMIYSLGSNFSLDTCACSSGKPRHGIALLA